MKKEIIFHERLWLLLFIASVGFIPYNSTNGNRFEYYCAVIIMFVSMVLYYYAGILKEDKK